MERAAHGGRGPRGGHVAGERGGRAGAGPDWADDELRNDLTDALYRATGRPVRIQPDGSGVRIELRLGSAEDAAALLARLP